LKAPTFLDPTEKPDKGSPFTKAEIILPNASITIMNNKGYKGSKLVKLK
jgi:hypothetical protein